ncbi:MAG: YceD family protein [Lachnospiraceae bacterium]
MNLSNFFNQEQKVEERELTFPYASFQGADIKVSSPLRLRLSNQGKGKVLIEGICTLELAFPCDRCLTPVKQQMVLDFSREVFAPGEDLTEEQREEQLFMDEYELNLEELLQEEMQLSRPVKVLCSEECKGICPVCGKNLNEDSCQCDSFVPDIRLANLMDIFNGK